jgi:hypothetical protein
MQKNNVGMTVLVVLDLHHPMTLRLPVDPTPCQLWSKTGIVSARISP